MKLCLQSGFITDNYRRGEVNTPALIILSEVDQTIEALS